MATLNLNVQKRTTTGKEAAKVMRRAGQVPAVIYGHGQENINLSINARELGDLLAHHGLTSLIVLGGDGNGETVFVKAVQKHPVRNTPTAIDFVRVSRNEKIHVKVPLVLIGEQIDVKTGDGLLVQSLQEVELVGKPGDLPDSLEVDISHLVLDGAALHVADIKLPAGVEIVNDAEDAVAAVNHPKAEEMEVEIVEEGTGEEQASDEAHQVPAEHGGPQGGGEGLQSGHHRSTAGKGDAD